MVLCGSHAFEDVEGVGEDGGVAEHLEIDELEHGSSFDVPVGALHLYRDLPEGCVDDGPLIVLVVAKRLDQAREALGEEEGLLLGIDMG